MSASFIISWPPSRVNDQGGAAGSNPDDMVAELEDLFQRRLLFQNAEVRLAQRLDRDGLLLRVERLNDPDAANQPAAPPGCLPRRRRVELVLVAQVVELHGEIDGQLAGVGLVAG
jgi:hypothetical protein